MNNINLKVYCLSLLIICISFNKLSGQQTWVVDEESKAKLSPFKFDSTSILNGKKLFDDNCKSCHGDPGKANNQPMEPPARDPASEIYQKNNDGELFYKITNGRETMPEFKNTLDANQRWEIIAFIRSFNKEYEQDVAEESEVSALSGSLTPVLSYNKNSKKIEVIVKQITDGQEAPLQGYEIGLFAKRYFGNIKIDETKLSDINGGASFLFRDDLPGDSIGKIELVLKISNEKSGVSISKDTSLVIGAPLNHVNILDQRAWWNVSSKAPLWLLITYTLTVLGVLGCILYILNIIYKIWQVGKQQQNDSENT